jgi:hypothetical protein
VFNSSLGMRATTGNEVHEGRCSQSFGLRGEGSFGATIGVNQNEVSSRRRLMPGVSHGEGESTALKVTALVVCELDGARGSMDRGWRGMSSTANPRFRAVAQKAQKLEQVDQIGDETVRPLVAKALKATSCPSDGALAHLKTG